MKKSGIIASSLLVLVVLSSFIFLENKNNITGNSIFDSSPVLNCSNESAKVIWDSFFKESSVDIQIAIENLGNGNCNYKAHKRIGTEEFVIFSEQTYLSGSIRRLNSVLFHVNLSETGLSFLDTDYEAGDLFDETYYRTRNSQLDSNSTVSQYIDNYFRFGVLPINFEETTGEGAEGTLCANCYGYEPGQNDEGIMSGFFSKGQSFDYLLHSEDVQQNCSSNWTEINTSCVNDQKTAWFNDTNDCGYLIGKPENVTYFCDSDGNGIIGNLSSVKKTNFADFKIFINGSELNMSHTYTSTRKVEIKDNATMIVEFNWNFSSPLNLESLTVKKSAVNSSEGYIIVDGLNVEKTVHVNREIMNSTTICIKDAQITSLNSISDACMEDDEFLLDCPGTTNDFSCILENSNASFKVSGLSHSAVIELIPCISSWSCSNWSLCINSSQKRTCTDTNQCVIYSGKPATTQSCNATVLITNSSNNSSTNNVSSSDTFLTNTDQIIDSTKANKPSSMVFIFVGIGIILFLVIAVVLFVLFKKKGEDSFSNFSPTQPYNPTPPVGPVSPASPASPQTYSQNNQNNFQ